MSEDPIATSYDGEAAPLEEKNVSVGPFLPRRVRRAVQSAARREVRRRVYGYARFSDASQRESSIDRQRASILAYLERAGLELDAFFADHGRTGTNVEREGLQNLLAACRAHPGAIVVVENADRLFRSHEVYARVKLDLIECGVVIHDPSGEMTELQEMIYAAMAAEDRRRMLDRMAAGRRSGALAGRWIASGVPYGYERAEPGRLVVHEEHAAIVREIFQARADGVPCSRIASDLDRRSVPNPSGTLGWNPASVYKISCNPVYGGYYVWNLAASGGNSR